MDKKLILGVLGYGVTHNEFDGFYVYNRRGPIYDEGFPYLSSKEAWNSVLFDANLFFQECEPKIRQVAHDITYGIYNDNVVHFFQFWVGGKFYYAKNSDIAIAGFTAFENFLLSQ